MIYSRRNTSSSPLLPLTTVVTILSFLSCPFFSMVQIPPSSCIDDPDFEFGQYDWENWRGEIKTTIMTCGWLTENPLKAEFRKGNWCNKEWLYGIKIGDKCPISCGFCNLLATKPDTDAKCFSNAVPGLEWHDDLGRSCDFYDENPRFCESKGDQRYMDYTANELCCGCDGGCLDAEEDWYDIGGPKFTCEWYAEGPSRCENYGHRFADERGFTANDICCVCGGGSFRIPEERKLSIKSKRKNLHNINSSQLKGNLRSSGGSRV